MTTARNRARMFRYARKLIQAEPGIVEETIAAISRARPFNDAV